MKLGYSKSISDNLKIVGIVSMVFDHVGFLFFPQVTILRIIGRLAFPIFAAGIVSGYQHTSDLMKYISRLLLFGLIAQFPYQIMFQNSSLNVLFTLTIGLLLIYFFDKKNYLFFAIFAALALFAPIEYDWFGPATIFTFFLLKDKKQVLSTYAVLVFIFIVIKNHSAYLISFYSIFGALLVLYPNIMQRFKVPKLPQYFFYFFYPAHLILLLIIKMIIT